MSNETRYWPAVTCVLLVVTLALSAFHHYGTNRRVARLAIEIAQDSGLLNEAVGSSLSMGIFVHGRVGEGDGGGNADLEIPVHGARSRAVARLLAVVPLQRRLVDRDRCGRKQPLRAGVVRERA